MATVKIKFRPSQVAGKEGTLYYQVIHQRVARQIRTSYQLYPDEWEDGRLKPAGRPGSPPRRRYLATLKTRLRKDCQRLERIIRQLEQTGEPYTAEQVVNRYRKTDTEESKLRVFVRNLVHSLRCLGQYRLAEIYITSTNRFLRFRGTKGDVDFGDIDAALIREYEAYLKANGLVPNTTSFYMHSLRAIYNRAVEKGLTPDQAPFRHVYTGIDKTVKRAIPSQVISRIKALDLSAHTLLEQARDLFLFSFYTRGMSFVDMAYLKKKDLQNGLLVYRRQKTAQQLFIKWEAPMQEIVNHYWDAKSPYLLPIITSPGQQERRQYLRAIHTLNEHLKEIGKMVNSPVPLTSYVARHGWANIARSRNVPIAVISEAMGHDSESTTRIYLASLDSSLVDQANSQIIHSI